MTSAIHSQDVSDCDWDEKVCCEGGYSSSLVFHKLNGMEAALQGGGPLPKVLSSFVSI